MRVVLMSADGQQLLHCVDVQALGNHPLSPLPGVVRWSGLVFVFAFKENDDSAIYRQTGELVLHAEPPVVIGA